MKYDVCVIGGAGHVGLPLGTAFALSGRKTILFDIDSVALAKIKSGKFPFKEEKGDESLKKAFKKKTLFVSDSPESIKESKAVFLVIGTPIDEHLNPSFKGIMRLIEKYYDFFHDGQMLILRSTLYPGTSEYVQSFFKKRGKKVRVAFCPERIVEGKALSELTSLPQIVSAFDKKTLNEVTSLFKHLTKRKIVPVEPIQAELAKLFSNSWRYIQFSVANQFYMIAKDHGLDYHQIYEAMTEDYDRMKNFPKPGFAAGPCLLKDTMQLSAFSNNRFFIGHAAMLVNEGLPNFVIQEIKRKIPLHDKTIGILGMAFKAESDDGRDSLSYKLKKVAEVHGGEVLCHDVYIKHDSHATLDDLLKKSHIIILATPHSVYRDIDPRKYPSKIFIDIWDFWGESGK